MVPISHMAAASFLICNTSVEMDRRGLGAGLWQVRGRRAAGAGRGSMPTSPAGRSVTKCPLCFPGD